MNYRLLSDRRREIGMSVDDLAAAAGVPKSTVAKIITGVTDNPGIETLKAITYALGLTLEDISDTHPPDEEKPVMVDGLTDREERFLWLYDQLGEGAQAIIEAWLSLSPSNRRILIAVARAILQEQSVPPVR